MPRENRWRIVSAVAAAHVAALLVLTLWSGAEQREDGDATTDRTSLTADRRLAIGGTGGQSSKLPGKLPADWRAITVQQQDLLLLRRTPAARAEARHRFGMEASADAVAGCLAWLEQRQDPITGAFGALTGQLDRDLAVQALASLALAGEGLGTSPVDLRRIERLRLGLQWLIVHARDHRHIAGHDATAAGLASLALVEGSLLLDDAALRSAASEALTALDATLPTSPGASGLGGFSLLAIETAVAGGLPVPQRARESAERIGRSLPAITEDPGRLGLALFARFIYGKAATTGSRQSLTALGEHLPIVDASEQINPLQWFFATLALREAGGDEWTRWSQQLQFTLHQMLVVADNGTAWIPAATTRYADAAGAAGDVFATSLVALNLQVAYRYLPLAPQR